MAEPADKGREAAQASAEAAEAGSAPTMPGVELPPPAERSSKRRARSASAFRRGDRIDRFVVLEILGAGGMAVVLSAYDPSLDRRVAIKLLRSELWRADGSLGRDRLLREAQAMARLSHPNVVTVHEVGALGDEVYIAMEHVSGRTLRDVIRETPRDPSPPWRAIAEPFLQAGRGLVAAHQVGLVHRDFKPENVLVGDDGRVRVTDFGLVSTAGLVDSRDERLASRDDLARDLETPTPIPLSASITRTGLVVGTPAYMAPEQDREHVVDERADQFSFCVSLWEALYGERPFGGTTVTEVLEAITAGRVQEPPAKARAHVPTWVHDALLRGLSHDPAKRWKSMDALLTCLASDPEAAAREYRRWFILGTVIIVLAVAAAIGLVRRPRATAAQPCSGAKEELASVWNDGIRRKVAARFAETGRSYAKDTFERAAGVIDVYASGWIRSRTEACEATLVHHRQSDAALDLRMRCLDRRRAALAATTAVWTTPISGDVVDRAIDSARALPALERCADVEVLSHAVPPPESPDERRRADGLTTELDRLDALAGAGRFTDALPAAKDVTDRARKLAYAPVLARALYTEGTLEHELGNDKAAEATLRETIHAAARARDDEQTARAWIALIGALAGQGKNEDALAQRTATEAFVERAGGAELLDAEMWTQLGTTAWNLGHFPEAEDLLGRALDAREKAHGPKHPDVAESLEALGNVLADEGRYADARVRLERAVAIREETLGPNHPHTASARNDLGMLLRDLGKPKEALASFEQALAVFEETLGPEHADVGRILNNIGLAYADQNDNAAAEPFLRRALAIKEKALGPTHPSTALTLSNLGAVLVELGRAAEARPLLERAFEIQRTTLGPNHPDLALPHHTLGAALRLEGKCKDAIPHFMEAKAIWEKTLGTEHAQTSAAYFDLGVCYTDLGRTADALPLLERALAIREKTGRSNGSVAETKWQLGRALWESGKDKQRGLALVYEARPKLNGLRQAREIDSWLTARNLAPRPAVTAGTRSP